MLIQFYNLDSDDPVRTLGGGPGGALGILLSRYSAYTIVLYTVLDYYFTIIIIPIIIISVIIIIIITGIILQYVFLVLSLLLALLTVGVLKCWRSLSSWDTVALGRCWTCKLSTLVFCTL